MTAWRQAIELAIGETDLAELGAIARSRTEPASRVERARMLLAYREDPSFFAVAQAMGVHHQTVQRCVERALAYGPIAALGDRPRPGKEPTITAEAKALGCEPRLPQGQGTRVSTRIVDNATPRPPCARAGPSRGAQLPCQTGSGHVVQHTQWAGDKAAQSALLPGTTRPAVQTEDGGGSVRLPPSKAY